MCIRDRAASAAIAAGVTGRAGCSPGRRTPLRHALRITKQGSHLRSVTRPRLEMGRRMSGDRSSCGMLESTTGTSRTLSKIAIYRAAMGDSQCENHEFRVFDRVDNPVVTDPDPPEIWISDERSCAARSRADAQGVDGLDDAARCWLVELGQLFESLGVI